MNRTKSQTKCRSALTVALSALLVLTCASWMLGAIAPPQAQAAGNRTIADVYGVTRSELVTWLKSHEHDEYYLNTPYKPYDWRSPNGDVNGWGVDSDGSSAGMNCTGFVWHALCAAHGWQDGIGAKLPALRGWASAIANESLENYTFATKEEMLASGKLEKGDVIWMWEDGDMHKSSSFHHVAIFWGDHPDEDLMWHSSGDANNNWSGINALTDIHGKASRVSYQIVKLGGKLKGAIALEKASADESTTKGNDNYSLEGAVYGVFEKKADAQTHNAKKAIKTFATDKSGVFTSEEEFDAGTYYVAETTAPTGYALDEKTYEVEVIAGELTKVNGGTVKDAPLLGGIELTKRSANADITDGNRRYSLKGAEYGVFKRKADAAEHDASKAEKVYKTTAEGSLASKLEWAAGIYYVAETATSSGYALDGKVYQVTVKPGEMTRVNAKTGFVSETPKSNPVTIWAAKSDAETPDKQAQGSATLEGALFEIAYYDGYYNLKTLPAHPTRTWIVRTDETGVAYARDDLKESGDEFYRTLDGKVTIPLGTVVVSEQQPPRGYLLGESQDHTGLKQLIQIKANSESEELGAYTAPGVEDRVKRGGVMVGKVDRQNSSYAPQGATTLAGAAFSIVTNNSQQVIVDGTRHTTGDVVAVIEAQLENGKYIARTQPDSLPVGYYTVYESSSSIGYLFDEESKGWRRDFEITEDGQVVDLTDSHDAVGNQVVRGDFSFSKIDGTTSKRLSSVPFIVTSQTTGESHVVVTDENGMLSTAADWNSHASKTNANDAAVKEAGDGYEVDEKLLDAQAGVWFDGNPEASCKPDDSLGALPYDTYTVAELPVAANEGLELVTFSVRVSRHARNLDLGTIDDNAGPMISTSLSDENGESLAAAGGTVTLIDTVSYMNLDLRKHYTLKGALRCIEGDAPSKLDGADDEEGKAAEEENALDGTDDETKANTNGTKNGLEDAGIIAEREVAFKPKTPNGTVEVAFEVDTDELEGARLVAFEGLFDEEGALVAEHADPTDEGQTVRIPEIGTTLADAETDEHESPASSIIELADTVRYRGLVPGGAYTMRGTLHVRAANGADAGPALDENGNPIEASQPFVASDSEGSVEVKFAFTAPELAGRTVVAFEELERRQASYAVHADILDEGQSVRMPDIGTKLVDGEDGDHAATANETIMLVDFVDYRNVTVGATYTITGTLHLRDADGVDCGPALDERGKPITATETFTAEADAGQAQVVFTFAAPNLAGMTVVAFEELSRDGRAYAVHADISDEEQTVRFAPPRIEKGEPPETTPPDEAPPDEAPPDEVPPTKTPPAESAPPGKATLPRTGDNIDLMIIGFITAAAAGFAAAARCITRMRQQGEIRINRGPDRR